MPASFRLQKFLPFLRWPRPSAKLLHSDALAGLTVGLMVVPQGVAYAQLAGMPPVTGIYASFLPALVAVLFSGSMRLSVGPVALTSLLISASLTPLATPGSAEWVQLAVWLALLSGLTQLVLGLARFGWLLNLINSPVLMAFTQAAGVLIITSQLPALLGLSGDWTTIVAPATWHLQASAFGLGALTLLMLARRWRPQFPSILVVVLLTAVVSWALDFEVQGGHVVGHLPAGLPAPFWPSWPGWHTLGQLALPTLVISLISFLETAASAKVDNQNKGTRWDQDQDLIGQGLAKIASGLSGSFATSASFSRSALNLYASAQSGWATVFSVGVVLLALLVLTPALHHVPQAVLAAIIIVAVLGLIKPREFARLWRLSRVEAVIAGLTFAITLLTAPALYWGVLTGVLLALSHFLYKRLHPRIVEVGLHADGSLRDRHLWQLAPLAPHTLALRMDAELDFGSAAAFERYITDLLTLHPGTRRLCLIAHPINRIDATGTEAFGRVWSQLQTRGIEFILCGLKLPVERVLKTAGLLEPSPLLCKMRTETELLHVLQEPVAPPGKTGSAS